MKRNITSQFEQWKSSPTRKPLLVYGARQVGKTYTLKQFGRSNFAKYHYLNFEEDMSLHAPFQQHLSPSRVIDEFKILGFDIDLSKDLIIFDEIQACPKALTSLKYFAEQAENAHICAAGSLLGLYMKDGSFPVGKVELCHMLPMTFDEFLRETNPSLAQSLLGVFSKKQKISQTMHETLIDYLKQYLFTGGMPEVVASYLESHSSPQVGLEERVRRIQKSLIVNYQADIAKHCGKTNAMHIERLWSHVPAQLASTQDGHASKFKFKDVVPNIRGYERLSGPLDWLQKARLVLKTPIINRAEHPISAFSKDNVFKLFMFDVGVLCAFNNLPRKMLSSFDFGTYKGYLAENFVAQELNSLGIPLLSWNEGTAQIEFIMSAEDRIIPIEVKSGRNTKAKSLLSFNKKYQPSLSIKLSLLPFTGRKEGHILNVPIYATHAVPMLLQLY